MAQDTREDAAPTRATEERTGVRRLIQRSELFIYIATSVILIVAAAGLLVVAVVEMVASTLAGDYVFALLQVLDRALLVMMLAEIVYTVRRIADRHQLELQPFFVVAIIAAIRRILVITAESAENVNLADPHFQAALVELGLLALMVLALAGAMRLVPERLK